MNMRTDGMSPEWPEKGLRPTAPVWGLVANRGNIEGGILSEALGQAMVDTHDIKSWLENVVAEEVQWEIWEQTKEEFSKELSKRGFNG